MRKRRKDNLDKLRKEYQQILTTPHAVSSHAGYRVNIPDRTSDEIAVAADLLTIPDLGRDEENATHTGDQAFSQKEKGRHHSQADPIPRYLSW